MKSPDGLILMNRLLNFYPVFNFVGCVGGGRKVSFGTLTFQNVVSNDETLSIKIFEDDYIVAEFFRGSTIPMEYQQKIKDTMDKHRLDVYKHFSKDKVTSLCRIVNGIRNKYSDEFTLDKHIYSHFIIVDEYIYTFTYVEGNTSVVYVTVRRSVHGEECNCGGFSCSKDNITSAYYSDNSVAAELLKSITILMSKPKDYITFDLVFDKIESMGNGVWLDLGRYRYYTEHFPDNKCLIIVLSDKGDLVVKREEDLEDYSNEEIFKPIFAAD